MNLRIEYISNTVWFGKVPSNWTFKYKFVQKSDSPIYEIGITSKKIISANESNRSMGTLQPDALLIRDTPYC